jgi:hypothetical protein
MRLVHHAFILQTVKRSAAATSDARGVLLETCDAVMQKRHLLSTR